MRFLIVPFIMFLISYGILRTSGIWSTKKNWKRIALEVGVSIASTIVAMLIVAFIIIVFN